MAITVNQVTTKMDVSGTYGQIRLSANVDIMQDQKIRSVNGSVFDVSGEVERYVGRVSGEPGLSITIDRKEDSGLLPDICTAVNAFMTDCVMYMQEGGAK